MRLDSQKCWLKLIFSKKDDQLVSKGAFVWNMSWTFTSNFSCKWSSNQSEIWNEVCTTGDQYFQSRLQFQFKNTMDCPKDHCNVYIFHTLLFRVNRLLMVVSKNVFPGFLWNVFSSSRIVILNQSNRYENGVFRSKLFVVKFKLKINNESLGRAKGPEKIGGFLNFEIWNSTVWWTLWLMDLHKIHNP